MTSLTPEPDLPAAGQAADANIWSPPAPPGPGQRVSWTKLAGSAPAAAVAAAARARGGLTLLVAADTAAARRWIQELAFYDAALEALIFPDWETLPYDAFSPHEDIVAERLATLHQLPRWQDQHAGPGVLVVPMRTLMQRVVPRSFVDGNAMRLATGDRYLMAVEREQLLAAGYAAVETVSGPGEFAVRGSLMDIFPVGADTAVRVDLLDDEIESLRLFDAETQRTIEKVDRLELLPAKEYPLNADSIARFRDRWHHTFDVDVRRVSLYQDISQRIPPSGVEYYLPFFFDGLETLFEFIPGDCLAVVDAGAFDHGERFHADVLDRYDNLRHDVERPILPPQELFLPPDEVRTRLKRHAQVLLNGSGRHQIRFASRPLPDLEARPRQKDPAAAVVSFVERTRAPVLFVADTAGRREVLQEFLARAGLRPKDVADLAGFRRAGEALGITLANLDRGLLADDLAVITESEIFGHQVAERRARSNRVLDPDQIIKNLTELHIGDPVVHIDHGIGRYQGLQTLTIDGSPNEFLTLVYADDAKLYVPVTSLHLISRYAGAEHEHAPLHRLGSDQWEKAKKKAREKIYDVAAELLNIYARREAAESFAFSPPDEDYRRFASQFPFEETADQARAIEEVIADLCAPRPSDRLICGDVGFGKTEVAMRAAFLAAQSGRQVAVLVPTTLLAQQHYDSFRDRFADWPFSIEVVSRLRSDGEVREVTERLRAGKVDILIGTHKLLSPGFSFSDLGLVIIDEEHRFGVRQKERLRALRAEVNLLTLTATPIPRTLNMAMSGMRDLSIIATPPAKRLSIKTFVQQSRKPQIKEAINRELMRGGQVFYLHNEVRDIDRVADDIADMVPEARIGIGHGQMPKRKLEQVMNDFYHRQLNVLVCTTIIENGIDVPNANTIVIDRADRFGLAQLHQLRGRVGRSSRQAYAYLLTPHPKAMTADAVKRLEAIQEAGELGVGFTLATHDLEIRGAGELLGEEQSGQIEAIGFSLYLELLDRAVAAIRAGQTPDLDAPLEPVSQEVNLHAASLIPDDFLPDVHSRLILYKRISNAATLGELDDLQGEVIDRFGALPEPLVRLFRVTLVKLALAELGIARLDLGEAGGRLEFGDGTAVEPLTVVKLVQDQPDTFRLDGATVLRVSRELPDFDARLAFAAELLETLSPDGRTELIGAIGVPPEQRLTDRLPALKAS